MLRIFNRIPEGSIAALRGQKRASKSSTCDFNSSLKAKKLRTTVNKSIVSNDEKAARTIKKLMEAVFDP